MRLVTHGTARREDLENELYDLGCDLVQAAAGLARAAADPEAARAVPALLGCIEAALEELSATTIALRSASRRPRAENLDRGYRNLHIALQDARYACHAARSLAARHAAKASGTGT